MSATNDRPSDLARRAAQRSVRRAGREPLTIWRREAFRLPREQARIKAREWFERFPKAAYFTEIEFWRELPTGEIEFTMRRLPTAD